jgi:hypothetical protein
MRLLRCLMTAVMVLALGGLAWAAPQHFTARLTGAQEVPPVKTKATGEARFSLSPDGKALDYKVRVTDLKNVTMAHIHVAMPGENGPVAVWLYPVGGAAGNQTGEVHRGTGGR